MPRPLRILLALLVPLLTGAAVGSYFLYGPRNGPTEDTTKGKLTQRVGATLKLGAALAESYGIRATEAGEVRWQERAVVYGRVVPNPQAAVEVRAPFAGVLKPVADRAWPGLGDRVSEHQTLALLETRLTPQERIDLRAKSAEALAKYKGAEESVKIQEDRLRRLEELNSTGNLAKRELDAAQLLLLDARTQRNAAHDQWQIYQQALAAPEGKGITVPLTAPLGGEVADLAAQPGLAVEPGAVLMRVVDFRRALLRLEFPLAQGQAPPEVGIVPAAAGAKGPPRPARYTGSAPQVEAASQRAALLYEVSAPADPLWRPGLFVKATFPDPSTPPRPAVTVPASALLYHQGRTLLYVQLSPGRYERREVEVLARDGDTLILTAGVRPGEAVVCAQPQVLLSEEFRRDTDDDD
jgi:RND family efflux transporter MFP subunit